MNYTSKQFLVSAACFLVGSVLCTRNKCGLCDALILGSNERGSQAVIAEEEGAVSAETN